MGGLGVHDKVIDKEEKTMVQVNEGRHRNQGVNSKYKVGVK